MVGHEAATSDALTAEEKLREIDEHLQRARTARELLAAALSCECSGLDTCRLVQDCRGRHRRTLQRLAQPADRLV